ncbi:hypothetical protein VTL71DRAFT_5491 [Oculimacula yallundae]|uniref:Secreted protein n=1 Tax=Oculimacula yallundae TaxID=86028 RepID=A0ABR4C182_9HELO
MIDTLASLLAFLMEFLRTIAAWLLVGVEDGWDLNGWWRERLEYPPHQGGNLSQCNHVRTTTISIVLRKR